MIIERHYDDESLIALMENEREEADGHLPACEPCSGKLQSFRTIAGALHRRDVWDARPLQSDASVSTIRNLRAFADRLSYEDQQAETYVTELLAGSREEWMPRLEQHPEWRTAGVVRKLVAMTTPAIMTMPLDGLAMSELSTEIADHLEPASYPSDTVLRQRGSAWRDHAYALYYVGRFAEALNSADIADSHLRECTVDEYDRARVSVVRALTLKATEDVSSAVTEARVSGETFVRFGDLARLASARLAEAHLLYSRAQFEDARVILEDLEERLRHTTNATMHGRVLGNLGYCYWKLGRPDEALRYNEAAVTISDSLGERTESARIQWSTASILASAGRVDEAWTRLQSLQSTFDSLNMTSEAALVRLDLSELLLARGEYGAVEELCRTAMRSFEQAGIPYTARALTALAYIQEAAQQRTATPKLVKHVREYIRRLPQEQELLFCPPPR